MDEFMQARKVPGGALAVVKERCLVYAKGYGWADREKKLPARPETLFRIASVSKPITAVAVMKLVEQGCLSLEARAFEVADLHPEPGHEGATVDERIWKITVRQLLQHTGGWDRDQSGDPMFRWKEFTHPTVSDCPLNPGRIISRMFWQRLDFDPGARYAYSNFGYAVLGRLIEKVTGQPYERFVREKVLAPVGIERMRVGASDGSREGESTYYTPEEAKVRSVFPGVAGKVAEPYGAFCLEAMDAHGGWVASAVDLARFAAALDDPRKSPLLTPETFQTLYAAPPPPAWRKKDGSLQDAYYGCGWMVRPVGREGRANYWHSGSLPGTSSLLVRRWDRLSWVVLFNQRSSERRLPDDAIDGALHRAAAAVKRWPEGDLFVNKL
jgi:N-acyl-D-amino-acid deacylase